MPDDEDVHTAIERRVTEIAGDVGAKLHTGRSRNDQVATDLRLWSRRSLLAVATDVLAFRRCCCARAQEAGDTYLPGYTHLQRAQPVLLAHHLLAHGWALARDVDRLVATVDRLNVSPLGAGALAGSSLPLDPDFVAEELGFAGRFENSLDAVSDRDFVAEALFDLALLGVHLSRMGEELVLWSTEEFGFCTLDDAYATGSSMLPQKKNPDVAELARGKAGRLVGHLTGLLVTLKGLPLAYNRDLQEDKEPLFDAVRQVRLALRALWPACRHGRVERRPDAGGGRRLGAAAIDLAELLVVQGMPFRQAHTLVGGLVRDSLERHVPLVELVQAHPDLGEAAARLLEPGRGGDPADLAGRGGPRAGGRPAGAVRAPGRCRPLAPGPAPGVRARRALSPGLARPRATAAAAPVDRQLLDADPLEVAPWLLGKVLLGRGAVGPDRRGRGLPGRRRPGLPRLPRSNRAQRHHVRPPRPALRLLHLRHALVRQRRLRPRGGGGGGPAAGPGAARGVRPDADGPHRQTPPGGGGGGRLGAGPAAHRRPGPLPGPGQPGPGPGDRRGPRRGRPARPGSTGGPGCSTTGRRRPPGRPAARGSA